MAKVQISIDDNLLLKVDKLADSMYMSRSGFISYACSQVVNSNAVLVAISDVSLALRKIADTGTLSAEEKLQLEDFERVVKLVTGSK
jgi:metal-responsive CopG/Arc/MetJ family transcriptional regulator